MNDGDATWFESNQRQLVASLARVRQALERHAAQRGDGLAQAIPDTASACDPAVAQSEPSSALSRLCETFHLSPFERDVLVLCAGMDLDASFGSLCASAQGNPALRYPTFSLALAALEGAHWSALTPAAPLRRWRLIQVAGDQPLTQIPLRIDERILHYLAGVQHLDERLSGLVEPVLATEGELVPSHRTIAEEIAAAWSYPAVGTERAIVQLHGQDSVGKRTIAAHACSALGWNLNSLQAAAVPLAHAEADAMVRLLVREAALTGGALLVDCDGVDESDATRSASLSWLVERLGVPLLITARHPLRALHRTTISLEVRKPVPSEQRHLWRQLLGEGRPREEADADALGSQFNLNVPAIRAAYAEAISRYQALRSRSSSTAPQKPQPSRGPGLEVLLWDACRKQARPRLNDLAQRIDSQVGWSDLVLPDAQLAILHEIATHVRRRAKVYESWGFSSRGARGLGISALFGGPSGTGKTMAAEVLARELELDLYRIDLSQVVSKYIGETEKNLSRVFDAAEEGGAVLLFDEADALFGKRTEVKDSHDRYANIEVSYLLQRMEAYRGLAILTTNMKSALDAAFMRRIRFIVQFPFPDAAHRARIWGGAFPAQTPTEDLDPTRLARLTVAGGNIRNIALNAAFLAADAAEPVRMTHLLRAARSEYAKLEKPLNEMETHGWT
jgi:predicted kinase